MSSVAQEGKLSTFPSRVSPAVELHRQTLERQGQKDVRAQLQQRAARWEIAKNVIDHLREEFETQTNEAFDQQDVTPTFDACVTGLVCAIFGYSIPSGVPLPTPSLQESLMERLSADGIASSMPWASTSSYESQQREKVGV